MHVNVTCITPSHTGGPWKGQNNIGLRMPDLDRTDRSDVRDNQFTLSARGRWFPPCWRNKLIRTSYVCGMGGGERREDAMGGSVTQGIVIIIAGRVTVLCNTRTCFVSLISMSCWLQLIFTILYNYVTESEPQQPHQWHILLISYTYLISKLCFIPHTNISTTDLFM